MKRTDTTCPNGHAVDPGLMYFRRRDNAWECLTCRRERSRTRQRRIRAEGPPAPLPAVLPPLGSKLRWDNLDDAPLGATPLEVCHVG